MIHITDPRIEEYLMRMAPARDPLLTAMEEKAKELSFPIVGPLVGRLLYLITRLVRPALVLEMGSGFGYSAYWIAKALSISSRVVLTDQSRDNIEYARNVFQEGGLADRAEFRQGDALQIGPEYRDVDVLFIDLDKYLYPQAIEIMLPSLSGNSVVIADNSLWYGRVAEEDPDRDTISVANFNKFMFSRDDFFSVIIPLRDGVLMALRLS